MIKKLLHFFLAVLTKDSTCTLRPDGVVQLLDCGFIGNINGVSFVGCLWLCILMIFHKSDFLINSSLS